MTCHVRVVLACLKLCGPFNFIGICHRSGFIRQDDSGGFKGEPWILVMSRWKVRGGVLFKRMIRSRFSLKSVAQLFVCLLETVYYEDLIRSIESMI